jgi:small-conductance mechanosensitive channel
MPADPAAIITAAHQRRELTRAKAIKTLRELDRSGTPITFAVVAGAAGVSRSWLYTQPDIRAEIQQLRETTRRTPTPAIPAAQRTTNASAQARLQAAIQRNRALAEDNQRLRRQLAQALGEQRQAPRQPRQQRPARKGHTSATIGPCQ